jgi:hypothetical protein
VTGARGVIINVTGGPDLSLVEVSEASSIVQEAADEDANIIFGAVVDTLLKGKVKITVIATGFGAPPSARQTPASAQTPVDMTPYTEHTRVRAEAMPAPAPASGSRLSIARRPLLDLPMTASNGAGASTAPVAPPAMSYAPGPDSDEDTVRVEADKAGLAADPDFDQNSTFDVPAFLRRQEG